MAEKTKTIIFKSIIPTKEYEEEFQFPITVTEEEISKEYSEWVWNLISDHCYWCEKGKE